MSSTPAATVGISFKNPGRHFALALKSVFAQTFTDWELILFDDMSTDGSFEFAQSLQDPRVRVVRDGRQEGLNVRLNQMVKMARGRYFFRMDSDDVMVSDRLERQIRQLDELGEDAVVGSACYSLDKDSNTVVGFRPGQYTQLNGFAARHSFHHPTVAAFTSWFLANPYSERFPYFRSEDAELWCRTGGKSRFVVSPEPVLFYREGSSNYTAYIGTEMVLLHLATERFQTPRLGYLKSVFRELSKIALAALMQSAGKFHVLVARRYVSMDPVALAAAQQSLDRIEAFPLASGANVVALPHS
jgi:glycosyltransferase involved in cell wall biosynthesis